MLNNIRKFAGTKMAGVLVGIIIVPFVLWGMGGVFSGGNQNNIASQDNKQNFDDTPAPDQSGLDDDIPF